MEKKWVAVAVVLVVLFGLWWFPLFEGKNVYEWLWEKLKERLKKE
jgi:hypothetical protein